MSLKELSKEQKQYLVLGALAAAILITLMVFGIRFSLSSINVAKDELAVLTDKIQGADRLLSRQDQVTEDFQRTMQALKEQIVKVPPQRNYYSWSTEVLYSQARIAGLEIDSIDEIGGIQNKSGGGDASKALQFESYALRVNAHGGFNNIKAFIQSMEKEYPLVRFTGLDIASGRDPEAHNIQLWLQWPFNLDSITQNWDEIEVQQQALNHDEGKQSAAHTTKHQTKTAAIAPAGEPKPVSKQEPEHISKPTPPAPRIEPPPVTNRQPTPSKQSVASIPETAMPEVAPDETVMAEPDAAMALPAAEALSRPEIAASPVDSTMIVESDSEPVVEAAEPQPEPEVSVDSEEASAIAPESAVVLPVEEALSKPEASTSPVDDTMEAESDSEPTVATAEPQPEPEVSVDPEEAAAIVPESAVVQPVAEALFESEASTSLVDDTMDAESESEPTVATAEPQPEPEVSVDSEEASAIAPESAVVLPVEEVLSKAEASTSPVDDTMDAESDSEPTVASAESQPEPEVSVEPEEAAAKVPESAVVLPVAEALFEPEASTSPVDDTMEAESDSEPTVASAEPQTEPEVLVEPEEAVAMVPEPAAALPATEVQAEPESATTLINDMMTAESESEPSAAMAESQPVQDVADEPDEPAMTESEFVMMPPEGKNITEPDTASTNLEQAVTTASESDPEGVVPDSTREPEQSELEAALTPEVVVSATNEPAVTVETVDSEDSTWMPESQEGAAKEAEVTEVQQADDIETMLSDLESGSDSSADTDNSSDETNSTYVTTDKSVSKLESILHDQTNDESNDSLDSLLDSLIGGQP